MLEGGPVRSVSAGARVFRCGYAIEHLRCVDGTKASGHTYRVTPGLYDNTYKDLALHSSYRRIT